MNHPLVFVMYDGINHSIFEGQVIAPLLKKLTAKLHSTVHIVSFEEHLNPAVLTTQEKFSVIDPRLTLTLIKRPRFTIALFLWHQAWQLHTILTTFSHSYDLYARGPLAGIIARRGASSRCVSLTIQARGLLAEEHAYTHRDATGIRRYAHALRKKQLWHVEKECYSPWKKPFPFFIEPVSPALKRYIQETYQTPSHLFVSPLFDAPDPVNKSDIMQYRAQIRKELAIPEDATVYIYNGSLKPWQCPQETIDAFKKAHAQDKTAFYLALTQETETMRSLLHKAEVPVTAFTVLHVPQNKVIRYLCAGDFGMLFRETHPLNWVSRPTKLLEYQAAGLQIIHNGTIALLAEHSL